MLTQEEYMDVLALKRQGWTIVEIADELGYHPATISKWLRDGGPPARRAVAATERVVDARWAARITELITPPKLLATSVFEIITAEGFTGSYPSVVREVRRQRGPRFRRAIQASVPIETSPGEESQFDWSDCSQRAQDWGLGEELWCFGAVASWSRHLDWWFTTSVDRQHTFEGLVRHFESLGGVPKVARTDRMGALGTSQGRRFRLHPPTIDFARHHGVDHRVWARRRQAQGQGGAPLPRAGGVVPRGAGRARATGERGRAQPGGPALGGRTGQFPGAPHHQGGAVRPPGDRAAVLGPPAPAALRHRLRRAPPGARGPSPRGMGWRALLGASRGAGPSGGCPGGGRRHRPGAVLGGRAIARHRLAPPGSDDVWDPAHRAAAEAAALGRSRPVLRLVPPAPSPAVPSPAPLCDYDVEVPDLAERYALEHQES